MVRWSNGVEWGAWGKNGLGQTRDRRKLPGKNDVVKLRR